MSSSLEAHIQSGVQHGYTLCRAVAEDRGEIAAHAFIGGLIQACATWNTHQRGAQSTFDLLAGLIDQTLEPKVAIACLEAELRAILRKQFGEGA